MIQGWFRFTAPGFPGSAYIPAIFGTVYLYRGWVFLVGGVHELRARLPGMMRLIPLAISVAFCFSLAVTLGYSGDSPWWELATLVTIMLLGHRIEMRSIFQASGALRELVKLLPSTAQRIAASGSKRSPSPHSPMVTLYWCAQARASRRTGSSGRARAMSTSR